MRTHWELDANHVVGRVIGGLIDYATDESCFGDSNPVLIEDCRKIAQRLLSDQPVAELDALAATADERDFEVVAEHVREASRRTSRRARWIGCTPSSSSSFASPASRTASTSTATSRCTACSANTCAPCATVAISNRP